MVHHYLDYKSGAVLVMNHNIETDVINTKGTAYGVELLIEKGYRKDQWMAHLYLFTIIVATK